LADLRSSLQQALGDAFLLERELHGGMSRVFVARETALGRTVVLKVLPPELAAGLSSDRFRREIQIAATLQHPHIVPLLSAGEAGEYVYYTMPLVDGESLRARLEREGELPVATATRIFAEVLRALVCAHRHGIIHRDIKPDNILLSQDEAQVTDFGIAKAITASAEQGTVTSAGVALGTPHYMAPEQAAADPTTDARADLYSLGVVAYEMLAGHPPFQGRTAAQILGAHAVQQPVPIRQRRAAVPPALDTLIMRLLEKRPSDRPQSADQVLRLLEAAEHSPEVPTTATAVPNRQRRGYTRWLAVAGVATLALILALATTSGRKLPPSVDRAVVAVAPFRVNGAGSSLGYLREGMVDLLAAKLGGTAGMRAVDPRTLLAAWRRKAGLNEDLEQKDAIDVAQRIGAGRLIQGDVVGTGRQITINAEMLEPPGARVAVRASVDGSIDSLPRLVDQLAGKLLALQAGEGEQRLASLTSTSLPALRAYLEGQALMRRGQFIKASAEFKRALQYDSTFALAGLGLSRSGAWFGQASNDSGAALAWNHREKLGPADRALLAIYVGDRFPGPRPWKVGIAAAEKFVQMAPDNPEAWHELADALYHFGALVGIPDALQRSAQAFARSLALDSSFVPAREHGTALALALGDTAGARKTLSLVLRADSTSPWATSTRWVLAQALGDSSARREALRTDSVMGPFIMGIGLSLGLPLQDVDALLHREELRAPTTEDLTRLQYFSHLNAIVTGWPSRAPPLPESFSESDRRGQLYLEGRFADGDSLAGASAGAAIEKLIGTPLPHNSRLMGIRYAAGQYALDRGRFKQVRAAIAELSSLRASQDSAWVQEAATAYALLLEAQLASILRSPQLPMLLAKLDSALMEPRYLPFTYPGNLIISRLFEQQGDLPRALTAIRRRVWELARSPIQVTYQREEGRLAALNGDREGAVRAYRRYLALRSGAEPRLQPLVAKVRAEVQALEQESTDK
jgi:eukaryotic-like serine/threonine-protein kinase